MEALHSGSFTGDETSPAMIPAWDASCFQKLLEGLLLYSGWSPGSHVHTYIGQNLWLHGHHQLQGGQDVAKELLCVLPDSDLS